MNVPANKIRLNKDLWFSVLGNKMVFGNSAISKEFHYTVSFGNRSGFFDLHLTNNTGKHFTVLNVSHQNIYEILPTLLIKIKNSIFDLSDFDENQFQQENSIFYKIKEIGDLTGELGVLTKKNRIIIDKESNEFKIFVDQLTEKHSVNRTELFEIKNQKEFYGIVKSKTENYFIIKSPYLGDQIFKVNNIDLDMNSIFEKILGIDIYEKILDNINEGILYLNEQK
ncbi:MAG TPA: hypothetical protein VIK55_14310 [Paludibacter sp.]